MENQGKIDAILKQVRDTLETAKQGYADYVGYDGSRKLAGLRNFVVFGRSVSFALQNLRTPCGDRFDQWYAPRREAMSKDPVCKHMNTVRNEILKEGKLSVGMKAEVKQFDFNMLSKLPQPPGATGFFIGDRAGGSGWTVPAADGSEQKFYVDMPVSVADVSHYFTDLDKIAGDSGSAISVQNASKHYLLILEQLVTEAEVEYGAAGTAVRKAPHLRVVK